MASDGIWMVYHSDWSAVAVFPSEVQALRHAVANSMSVGFARYGVDYGGGRFPEQPGATKTAAPAQPSTPKPSNDA